MHIGPNSKLFQFYFIKLTTDF